MNEGEYAEQETSKNELTIPSIIRANLSTRWDYGIRNNTEVKFTDYLNQK